MKLILKILVACCLLQTATAQTTYDLRCEGVSSPLGVEQAQPRFSWKIATDRQGYRQAAYQIQVRKDGKTVWDSRKVASDQSVDVCYRGPKLQAATHYEWRMRCWGNVGKQTGWSTWQTFATGLPDEADWQQAQWIAMERDASEVHRLPLLRKTFSAPKAVRRATAYVCGLGHFDLFINGQKVGNHFLDAGWTKYDKEALYVTFDATPHLRQGNNALGVMLGNGFYYIPRERYFKLLADYGAPKLRLLLRMEYEDGSTEDVVSDTTWRVAPSPIVYSSIYGGEDYDATQAAEGWATTAFDDAQWQQAVATQYDGKLHAQMATPVIVRQEIPVKKIFKNSQGHWIYDLGQNFSGIISVSMKAARGRQIVFRPAELLKADSTVNQRASGQPYYFSYRADGSGVEQWQPQFSYYGFRYVQVEGAVPDGEENPDGLPVLTALTGLHTSNAAEEAGSFTCSNPLMNQIHTLIDWAIRSNMQSVLTDCPHREKLGWIEQVHLMQPSLCYRYNLQALYAKILQDMETSQRPDGCIPSITPEYTRFADGFEDSPEWGSAFIISPWYAYLIYGDTTLIRRHYPAMKRYLDYLTSRSDNGIVAYGLGDWFDIGPQRPGPAQLTSNGVTATAIYYYDITLMEKMAVLLGYEDDTRQYARLASTVKAAFRKAFVSPDTYMVERNSQTANAIALFTGLLDEAEAAQALQHLIADIQQRGNALTAGDIGFRYVLASLAANGRSDVVYDMNTRSDVPGYGWQLVHGATALTESWQAYGSVSNNHFMLGHLMEWLYAWLGGIRQQENSTGFRNILIAPQIVGDITSASTSYQSPYGEINCTWKLDDGRLILKATIPPNTDAKILLPHANGAVETKNVASGSYVFEIENY